MLQDSLVLLPVYVANRQHWILIVADIPRRHITVLDSMPCESHSRVCPQGKHVQRYLAYVFDNTSFVISSGRCRKQGDNVDCGIHVVLNALHVVNGEYSIEENNNTLHLNYVNNLNSDSIRQNICLSVDTALFKNSDWNFVSSLTQ